jgi:hypothetical protein
MRLVELQRLYESGGSLYEENENFSQWFERNYGSNVEAYLSVNDVTLDEYWESEDELLEQMQEKYQTISDLLKEPTLTLFRAIQAARIDYNELGVSWAFRREMAIPYYGGSKNRAGIFIVQASVPTTAIDHEGTIDIYMEVGNEHEEEARLYHGKEIIVTQIEKNGKAQNLNRKALT